MVFREGGSVMGVLPLFLHEWEKRRQLTLIGAGISDYLDPLFVPLYTPEIVDRIALELNSWTDWDICDWQDLSAETPLAALGTAVEDSSCSFIPLDRPFEEYMASRPKDLKRNLRRYREKAETIAPVSFEAAENADDNLLSRLVELHRERWACSGQSGMIEANGSEKFLRTIATLFAHRGLLRIFTIRFGPRVTAALLAFCYGETVFSYLSAFDPRDGAFGFGRELLFQSIRYAQEHGYRIWNFLRGDEPYKSSWGAFPVEKRRVIIRR